MTGKHLWLGLLLCLFTCFGCRTECKNDENRSYRFEVPFTLSPAQEIYYVHDTVWLDFEFNSHMLEEFRDRTYDMEGQDLYLSYRLERIDTNAWYNEYHEFSFGSEYGTSYPDLSEMIYRNIIIPSYENGLYRARYFIVFENEGLYFLFVGSGINHFSEYVYFDGKCPGFGVAMRFTLTTSIADNNFSLFQDINTELYESEEPSLGGYREIENYLEGGRFTFVVE